MREGGKPFVGGRAGTRGAWLRATRSDLESLVVSAFRQFRAGARPDGRPGGLNYCLNRRPVFTNRCCKLFNAQLLSARSKITAYLTFIFCLENRGLAPLSQAAWGTREAGRAWTEYRVPAVGVDHHRPLYFFASRSRISPSSFSVAGGSGGAAGAASACLRRRLTCLIIRKIAKAIIRKSSAVLQNTP